MAPKDECLRESKFIEIEGKMKGNNELTALAMTQIKEDVTKLTKTVEDFIKEIRVGYVTKEEHTDVKTRLQELTGKLWNINFYIILAIIGAVLAFVLKK